MYIIFSPTKLMNLEDTLHVKESYRFKEQTDTILNYFYDMDMKQIGEILDLRSSQMAHQVYSYYHSFNIRNHPLFLYQGQSFKQLEFDAYTDDEFSYVNEHLRILSALYGVLKPFDVVFPYRLDFKSKIKYDLKKYWRDIINYDLAFSKVIINLASTEFSSLVTHDNMINIKFYQLYGTEYKMASALVKQARGKYLDWMIKNKITPDRLTEFSEGGYLFSEKDSDSHNLVFKTLNSR